MGMTESSGIRENGEFRDWGRRRVQGLGKTGNSGIGRAGHTAGAPHLYRLRPPMVSRLEKTLKLCMCLGQDWMFRYPAGTRRAQGGSGGPGGGGSRGVPAPPAPLLTRDLPHRPEHVQLLRVQRRDVAPGIPAGPQPSAGLGRGAAPPNPPPLEPPKSPPSPLQARDEEVEVAQDLGAVDEGVDVA